ncbi:MAG: chromate transporter, partial [Clostridia bacterium]|nr:chromate transporter [Clostridia bacterium]
MLAELFLSFLQVGLFSVGGGYVAIPLIQQQVVTQHGWLPMSIFNDLVTIAEMTPGPIGINAATFVGVRVGGFPGALVASLGFILPSLLIVSLLCWLY